MEKSKVVARFRNGEIFRGSTKDFSPNKASFNLQPEGGKLLKIDFEKLKAVFFVKDLKGNKERKRVYKDSMPWGGKKVKVIFSDGEVIIGYTQHYSPGPHGFFITPADSKGNNERVFVITSATEKVVFL